MIRRATVSDADAILGLVNSNAEKGLMLKRSPYDVYKNIMSFFVFERDGKIVGCVRLAVLWRDLAEVASLAVAEEFQRNGIGTRLIEKCEEEAARLGIERLMTLTYQCELFAKCGFAETDRQNMPHKVFGECLNCPKIDCCDEHAFIKTVCVKK